MNITASFDKAINYAFQQNAIPLIKELVIRNDDRSRRNVRLRITTEPAFATPLELAFSELAPAEHQRIAPVDLRLSHDFLAGLNEKVRGELRVEILEAEQSLCSHSEEISLLARNEWCGLSALPEILAAFVLPNDPAILPILGRASEILQSSTGRNALNGYQDRNRRRAWEQAAAIHAALCELRLRYIVPPTSFENTGQKVAFPSEIITSRLATCLDLSLLFCACCERAGLAPLVLIHEGHAYAGCWLEDRSLPDAAIDDLQHIRKLCQEDLLCVFETTLLTSGTPISLTDAERAAKAYLDPSVQFRMALDVRRARSSRILPIPSLQAAPSSPRPIAGQAQVATPEQGLGTRTFTEPVLPSSSEQQPRQVTRVDQWKARLLDLTKRNRLLNFRETKGTIRILSAHPDRIEDELAANTSLSLLPKPTLLDENDPRSASATAARERKELLAAHLAEELSQKRLHTHVDAVEHSRRLTEIYRSARTSLDENGTNTLYAAVGFLEWKEAEHSDRSHRAPLLLVPVELTRKSVLEGFALRRLDEETRLNVTLIEMLRQQFQKEIPGVDPLPEDDNGVHVAQVFGLFREAVRDLVGWELIEEVWLGQFSFTKFLLWKDLSDRLDSLAKNRIVNHLVNAAGTPYPDTDSGLPPAELDTAYHPKDIFCPRSADSTQLAAIMAAAQGHDFVLEGPPGTGKSQTITNIIAHSMATGKRVLFVAEKRAALDVVHRRLAEEGLAPFCLELHSNKTGKAEVLAQLRDANEFTLHTEPNEWAARTEELRQLRDSLNAYVQALHEAQPCGLSAYDCIDHSLPRLAAQALPLSAEWPCPILATTKEQLERTRALCAQVQERTNPLLAQSPAGLSKHPLAPLTCTEWAPTWAEQAHRKLTLVPPAAAALQQAASELDAALANPAPTLDAAALGSLRGLAESLLCAQPVAAAFITTPWVRQSGQLQTWHDLVRERANLRAELTGYDEGKLLALDLPSLRALWDKAQQSWFLLKWFRVGGLRRQLRSARTTLDKPEVSTMPRCLDAALRLRDINAQLSADKQEAEALLGILWAKGEPKPEALSLAIAWGQNLHAQLVAFAGANLANLARLRQHLAAIFNEDSALFAPTAPLGKRLQTFNQAQANFLTQWQATLETLHIAAESCTDATDYAGRVSSLCSNILEAWGNVRDWCAWQRLRQEAAPAGLLPLIRQLENTGKHSAAENLSALFEHSFRLALLNARIDNDRALREFFGMEQNERIRRFRALDDKVAELTRELIRARLSRQVADAQNINFVPKAEIALLSKELAKRMRHIPVRKLLANTPKLTARLKPCMLMSPLSVAQYLDPTCEAFDLVVFDEASQIPVWDAVGAIARGKQTIVVGDPKQLPPTNFFNAASGDEEDFADDLETESQKDLESVLDELLGNKVRHRRLCWHYRSRHEGLISFSNARYYDGQLLTTPSPTTRDSGVSMKHLPNAAYDKGKTRTNPGEAKALVEELVARLRSTDGPARSYGIVTFSLAQQQLIENLLDEQRSLHPEIETHFGGKPPVEGEPVFVKNLESVQGDERDVILFSIGYGKDSNGRLSMNFGPLNREGGQRRLNVAVTRAKHEIRVFSSLSADDIDLKRTRAQGVQDLKAFLDHAARGGRTQSSSLAGAGPKAHSEFIEHVAGKLRAAGYTVHQQVGSSGYRVDLAVVDPSDASRYLLALECDGPNYRNAATARDRDKLRQAMLAGLGWKVHRIWSTDWWHKPEEEERKLLDSIALLAQGRERG